MFRSARHEWSLFHAWNSLRRRKSRLTRRRSGTPLHRRLRLEALEDRRLLAVTLGFTGPYSVDNWTSTGITGGTASLGITIDGATGFFDYSVTLAPGTGVSQRTADFTLLSAPVTGSVTFDFAYTGNHRFFQAAAEFSMLSAGAATTVLNSSTFGDFSFSGFGSATLIARAGQSFGFRIGGRNNDSDSHIDGTLTISNIKFFDSIIVDSLGDVSDGNFGPGQLTLREAVGLANTTSGADTITFAENMSGQTILLGGTELGITESLTIDATELAAPVTIDAQQQSRVLNFTTETGDDLTLAGLTIRNGRTTGTGDGGGGIRFASNGTLTLTQSTVSGNSTAGVSGSGGGIYSLLGNVTLMGSTISGNSTTGNYSTGGGVYAYSGAVTLRNSTISGNSTSGVSAKGGGIYSYFGAVTLANSTLSGNSTGGSNALGGGIYIKETSVSLESSTLSGNSTTGGGSHGGGIAMSYGFVSLNQSTVTGNSTGAAGANGGGIFVVGAMGNLPVAIANSILAGNTVAAGSAGPDLVPDNDSMLTVNFSVIGTGITPTAGDENIVTDALLLGPLADNGGPTQTHAPPPDSAAIDAGDPAVLFNSAEFDQRGAPFVRVFGGRVDIGAFEAIPLVVNDAGDGDDGNIANGVTTLREAINFANAASGADTITFADNMSGNVILLGGAELEITESLTIDASTLDENVIIDAQQQSRVVNFTVGAGDLTLAGLTIRNGKTTSDGDGSGGGGGIRFMSDGTLTLSESILSGNSTTGENADGGGIYTINGEVTLTGSTLSGNSTAGDGAVGGGISTTFGDVTLNQSTLAGNSTEGFQADGGGIRTFSGDVTLNRSTLSENSTAGDLSDGGGIYASGGTVRLTDSTLSGNSTAGDNGDGGGIFSYYGPVTLTRSTLSGNSTAGEGASGGGIFITESGVTLESSTLSGNSTTGGGSHGGGIAMSYGAVWLNQSTVTGNSTGAAGANGGGIFVVGALGNLPVTIANSILAGNTVAAGSFGPDLVPDGDSMLEVNYSVIGTGITPAAGGNNIVTNTPLLGPLADNGGPTQTHALLPGSPALDAGDPNGATSNAVHVYELDNSGADELGGPSLVVGGGFFFEGSYFFGPNQGANVNSAITPDEYSIELVFSFDALGGYQKIIDFHDLADDTGLYSTGTNLDFFGGAFAADVLSEGESVHLVVTRDGPTDAVAVYVDGVEVLSFVDTGDIAVFNGIAEVVRFFQDDNATGGTEAASGFVDRIRIYNRDLSGGEVAGLAIDQRGAPFVRVFDGDGTGGARIDIGAFEAQPNPLTGDYNFDDTVNAADYTVWRNTLGATNDLRADGDGDGMVDEDDFGVWKLHFGETNGQGAGSGEQGVQIATALSEPKAHVADGPPPLDYSRPLPEGEAIEAARIAPSLYDGTALLAANIFTSNGSARRGGSLTETSPSRLRAVQAIGNAPRDDALLAWLESTGVGRRPDAEYAEMASYPEGAWGAVDEGGLIVNLDAAYASVGSGVE